MDKDDLIVALLLALGWALGALLILSHTLK